MNLYRNESSDPKRNAQRNLCGRTHYVDDDTLRFHKSRVLSARHTDGGLLFCIVTSDAMDMRGATRGFRYVIFDVFGTTIERPDLEHAYKRSEQASKAMWAAVNALDAKAITIAAIDRQERQHVEEMNRLRQDVAKLVLEGKAA